MNNVIPFAPRAPQLLWAPRRGQNPAWRIHAPAGQVIYMWDRLARMDAETRAIAMVRHGQLSAAEYLADEPRQSPW
jgi:hypothetical protein